MGDAGKNQRDVGDVRESSDASVPESRIPERLTWAAVTDFFMSRYGGMDLVSVSRIPYEAYQDLMEAARLNTVSPSELDKPKRKIARNDADVNAFLKGFH